MNTLHDLRATLERAADGFDDTERATRAADVHQRVRGVRRRRVAAVAVAAVVAVVVTVGAFALHRTSDRVEPVDRLHQVDLPEHAQISGKAYALDDLRAVEPGDDVQVQAPAGRPSAVSLVAVGLGDGSATLSINGEQYARVVGGREYATPLEFMATATLRVELDGAPAGARVGLAVYREQADPTPSFRENPGTTELVAGAYAEPGGSFVEVTVKVPLDELLVATYCSDESDDLQVNLEVDGEVVDGQPCSQVSTNDGTDSSTTGLGRGGGSHTVRAFLSRAGSEDEVSMPGVVVGVAAYRPGARSEVLGTQVPTNPEIHGRRWVLDRVIGQDRRGAALSASIATGQDDRLLVVVTPGRAHATWTSRLGKPVSVDLQAGSASTDFDDRLLAGDTYDVEVTGGPEFRAAIVVYRPE